MSSARPGGGHRIRALAYTLVTTTIVLLFAVAEWATERFVSEHSRAASLAIEIGIVVVLALVFRPIHRYIETSVEEAFNRRKRRAIAALERFRHELSSFDDMGQLLRRVIEAIEHYCEARACAIYLHRDGFRAERSSFDTPAIELDANDPLVMRLLSSGAPARPRSLNSAAPGTHAFPMTSAGELVGFLCIESKHAQYDADESAELSGLASDLALALVALDPTLRVRKTHQATNIPADLSPLLGRERECAEIDAALNASRLVTLTGAGGVGKTRVALACAAASLERHEHGAWFVDLAPIRDGTLIPATILGAMSASAGEQGSDLSRLIAYLRPRDSLIVVDNCEHLVANVAPVAARIVAECPRITIVATSRELLHLTGERVYRLGPLAPNAAVSLFAERAAAVCPSFAIDEEENVVREICDRLDGVPLAIELAAARVRALGTREIAARLDERFRLLTNAARTAMPRQQTLAATVEWSYELLTPEEQSLFRRLAVFRGSFSLAAAAAVCAEGGECDEFTVLDVLTSLADKSLLTVTLGVATRYRLLETIRAFAAEKSLEAQASTIARFQHASYFGNLAAQAYHEFDSRLPPGWLERLAPDIDNFRAALEWLLEGSGDRYAGAQLAADCGPLFLRMGLLVEGLRSCDAARLISDLSPATAGRIEYVASMMHNNLLEFPQALACALRAVTFYRESPDRRGRIRALSQLAQLYARAHRFDEAKQPAEEAIREARSTGEPRVLVSVLRRCAFSLPPEEIETARALFEEALAVARASDEREEACHVLIWWATRESDAAGFDRAIDLSLQALACADGDTKLYLEVNVAEYAIAAGRYEEAEPHARRALELSLRAQHPLVTALAFAFCAPSQPARDAALLFGYATARLSELAYQAENDDQLALQNIRDRIESALDGEPLEPLLERGAALRQHEALTYLAPPSARRDATDSVATDARGDRVGTLLR